MVDDNKKETRDEEIATLSYEDIESFKNMDKVPLVSSKEDKSQEILLLAIKTRELELERLDKELEKQANEALFSKMMQDLSSGNFSGSQEINKEDVLAYIADGNIKLSPEDELRKEVLLSSVEKLKEIKDKKKQSEDVRDAFFEMKIAEYNRDAEQPIEGVSAYINSEIIKNGNVDALEEEFFKYQEKQQDLETTNEQVQRYQERFGDRKKGQKPENVAEQEAARVAAEELYARAVLSVIDRQDATADALKKELGIGSNKARDLLNKMEKEGIISAPSEDFLKVRTVLVEKDEAMPDDVNEAQVVEAQVVEEENSRLVGSEIGDEAFWKSPAAEGFDKSLYLLDKDLYAKVKEAHSEYTKNNAAQSESEDKDVDAEEKPETLLVEELENDTPLVANDAADNGWVERYDVFLKENAEKNGKTWQRAESPEGTLKGVMGEDLDLSFAAESKVSFAMKKDKIPTAESFKELVALSKKEDMDLDISGITKLESRKAIIEAAAKGGVEIAGLSDEEQGLYKSFLATEERETVEKEGENSVSYLSSDRAANINLRKFDRLAQNPDTKVEFEAVLARYEGAGAKIGGDDKESEIYTLASYAKALRAAEKSPENEALAGDEKALEVVLSKYGVAIDKQVSADGVEIGVIASSGKYDAQQVAASIEHIGDRSMSEFEGREKYKSSPEAEQIMARRGGLGRSN